MGDGWRKKENIQLTLLHHPSHTRTGFHFKYQRHGKQMFPGSERVAELRVAELRKRLHPPSPSKTDNHEARRMGHLNTSLHSESMKERLVLRAFQRRILLTGTSPRKLDERQLLRLQTEQELDAVATMAYLQFHAHQEQMEEAFQSHKRQCVMPSSSSSSSSSSSCVAAVAAVAAAASSSSSTSATEVTPLATAVGRGSSTMTTPICVALVMQCLSLRQVALVARVCKSWREASSLSVVWAARSYATISRGMGVCDRFQLLEASVEEMYVRRPVLRWENLQHSSILRNASVFCWDRNGTLPDMIRSAAHLDVLRMTETLDQLHMSLPHIRTLQLTPLVAGGFINKALDYANNTQMMAQLLIHPVWKQVNNVRLAMSFNVSRTCASQPTLLHTFMTSLQSLPNLQSLEIVAPFPGMDMGALPSHLTSLHRLRLTAGRPGPMFLQSLSTLHQLRELRLQCLSLSEVEHLLVPENFQELHTLTLSRISPEDKNNDGNDDDDHHGVFLAEHTQRFARCLGRLPVLRVLTLHQPTGCTLDVHQMLLHARQENSAAFAHLERVSHTWVPILLKRGIGNPPHPIPVPVPVAVPVADADAVQVPIAAAAPAAPAAAAAAPPANVNVVAATQSTAVHGTYDSPMKQSSAPSSSIAAVTTIFTGLRKLSLAGVSLKVVTDASQLAKLMAPFPALRSLTICVRTEANNNNIYHNNNPVPNPPNDNLRPCKRPNFAWCSDPALRSLPQLETLEVTCTEWSASKCEYADLVQLQQLLVVLPRLSRVYVDPYCPIFRVDLEHLLELKPLALPTSLYVLTDADLP